MRSCGISLRPISQSVNKLLSCTIIWKLLPHLSGPNELILLIWWLSDWIFNLLTVFSQWRGLLPRLFHLYKRHTWLPSLQHLRMTRSIQHDDLSILKLTHWPLGDVAATLRYNLWIHINTLRPRQNGHYFAGDIFKCIFLNENALILFKISLKFVPKVWIDNIPALVQIMAWRRPGDKQLSEPMMVSLLMHICVTQPQWVNTLGPRQNGRHFADDIFKCIFLNENVRILIKISLRFVPKGPINNIPSLVQIMAWRRPGDKPLSEAMMVNLPTHICVTRPEWVKD